MRHRRRLLLALVALSVPFVTTACGGGRKAEPVCPRVLVLADAATLTEFAPGRGTDLLDIDYEVEIADVLSGCRVDRGDRNTPVLTTAVAPILLVERGAANREGTASFTYFVSVVGRGEAISTKQEFPVAVRFEGNRSRLVLREDDPPVSVNIPLTGATNPLSYEIIVGLQLSEQQLAYNQARRAGVR